MTAGWEVVDGKLARSFELPTFPEAVQFVVRVGEVAEAHDHHPDIDIRWRTVHLAVCTHSEGNAVTAKDHALAEAVNALL